MKKIKIINFSVAYTKYLSKLSEKISTDEIDLEYVWCKNMSYWEPTMKSSDKFAIRVLFDNSHSPSKLKLFNSAV